MNNEIGRTIVCRWRWIKQWCNKFYDQHKSRANSIECWTITPGNKIHSKKHGRWRFLLLSALQQKALRYIFMMSCCTFPFEVDFAVLVDTAKKPASISHPTKKKVYSNKTLLSFESVQLLLLLVILLFIPPSCYYCCWLLCYWGSTASTRWQWMSRIKCCIINYLTHIKCTIMIIYTKPNNTDVTFTPTQFHLFW